MGSSLIPYLSLLLSVFFLFLSIPPGFSNPDFYTGCRTNFVCGDFSVGYPFWGKDRPDGCGVPGMDLKCQDDKSIIEIAGVDYLVLQINEKDKILKIARHDYADGLCQPEFTNTTLDSELFEYASDYWNFTLFYGCPDDLVFPDPFKCSIKGSPSKGGYTMMGSYGPGSCYSSVIVPVSEANWGIGVLDVSVLQSLLKQGFEVKWKVDYTACKECMNSEGACGYDIVNNGSTCYCRHQSMGSKSCSASPDVISPNPGTNLSSLHYIAIGKPQLYVILRRTEGHYGEFRLLDWTK